MFVYFARIWNRHNFGGLGLFVSAAPKIAKSAEIMVSIFVSYFYCYCLVVFDLGAEGYRVTTPTATETMLPWKREDDYESGHHIKQHEFPAWCSNKEYLAYSSPSATFLGKEKKKRKRRVSLG